MLSKTDKLLKTVRKGTEKFYIKLNYIVQFAKRTDVEEIIWMNNKYNIYIRINLTLTLIVTYTNRVKHQSVELQLIANQILSTHNPLPARLLPHVAG